jgi:hypothetical protein
MWWECSSRAQAETVSDIQARGRALMTWDSVFRCDVCGTVKKDANKWLLAKNGYTAEAIPCFRIYHWDDYIAKDPNTKIVCSEHCLNRLLQPFLSQRTIPTTEEIPK